MISMRYSLGMWNFPFKGWRPLGCAIFFFWWVTHFLQFNGVPFQIDCNWASWKGVSHSFRRIGATFKHKGQLRSCFFLVSEAFASNEWDVFSKERTFLRNGATFNSTTVFFFKGVWHCYPLWKWCYLQTSNIDKSWALKGVLLFSRPISYSATIYTSYFATVLFLFFKQMAAALSEVFSFKGKCICLRTCSHDEKGRQEECT